MLGQRLRPRGWHKVASEMPDAKLKQALASLKANVDAALAKLPQQQAFLDGFCPSSGDRAKA
jgi:tryptophan halogenase